MKRKRAVGCGNDEASGAPSKRAKSSGRDHFERLSDELVLRTLSFLPIDDLTRVERACRRFQRLATDNEIWREKFYNQFVRPRARRLPGLAGSDRQMTDLHYASKSARWLEHQPRSLAPHDWKRRYRIKFNWSKGRCKAHEVALDGPLKPRILVRICRGLIVTVTARGIRAYSQRHRPQLLSSHSWQHVESRLPTALAMDARNGITVAVIGFSDGVIELYTVSQEGGFTLGHKQVLTESSTVSGLAVAWPYVLGMTGHQELSLYQFSVEDDRGLKWSASLLAHLHSDAIDSPVALSVRRAHTTLVASVAYSFHRLNAGWCLGLQEIRLSLEGGVIGSRVTSSVDTPLRDFPLRKPKVSSRSAVTAPLPLHPQLMHRPNSLSHAGCYILASLPDNTLMVYTVVSDSDRLEINAGRRLWGHTASVSGAEVSDRGKALSVSARGDEVRVWELEEILSSYSLAKTSTELKPFGTNGSLHAALVQRGNGLGLAASEMKVELPWIRHSVGFDDEQVVVLGERDERQILSFYDFGS